MVIKSFKNGGRSQVVRQWIVTPPFAGSNPVVHPFLFWYKKTKVKTCLYKATHLSFSL